MAFFFRMTGFCYIGIIGVFTFFYILREDKNKTKKKGRRLDACLHGTRRHVQRCLIHGLGHYIVLVVSLLYNIRGESEKLKVVKDAGLWMMKGGCGCG